MKQEWWLPTELVDAEASQCILLGQLVDSKDTSIAWWVEIRVSRVLQCLDAIPLHFYAASV